MDQQRRQRAALPSYACRQVIINAKLADHMSVVEQLTISQERNRLARELHDTLAHSLSALTVQLEAAQAQWERDPKLAHQCEGATKRRARDWRESRRSCTQLRASLEERGLTQSLENSEPVGGTERLASDTQRGYGLDFAFTSA